MSFYQPAPAPPRHPATGGARPGTVTGAAALQLVMAGLSFVYCAVPVAMSLRASSASVDYDTGSLKVVLALGIGVGFIGTIVLTLLAVMNLRGRSWARIVSFVLHGLGIAYCGVDSVSLFALGAVSSTTEGTSAPIPGWFMWSAGGIQAVGVLLSVAVIIMLVMRRSGQYFAARSGRARPAGPQQPPYPAGSPYPQQPPGSPYQPYAQQPPGSPYPAQPPYPPRYEQNPGL